MKKYTFFAFLLFTSLLFSNENNETVCYEHISLTSAYPVRCTITYPKNTKPIAKAVIISGSGNIDVDGTIGPNTPLKDLSVQLAELGVVTIRFPKRAKIYKTLTYEMFSIEEEYFEDTVACLKALKSDTRLNTLPTLLIGHSLGGTLAPHITKIEKVDALIVLGASPRSPYVIIPEQLKHLDFLCKTRENVNHKYYVKYNPICKRAEKNLLRKNFKLFSFTKAYLDQWRKYSLSVISVINQLSIPVLIVGFGTDYQSTKEDFKLFQTGICRKNNASFVWLEDLNHFFMNDTKPPSYQKYYLKTPISNKVSKTIYNFIKSI